MATVALVWGLAVSSAAPSAVVTGEAVALDLGRKVLVVKTAGPAPRELDFAVDGSTRFMAGGRDVGLEDVRPGDRVVVSSAVDETGLRRASLVRAGRGRGALVPAPARP